MVFDGGTWEPEKTATNRGSKIWQVLGWRELGIEVTINSLFIPRSSELVSVYTTTNPQNTGLRTKHLKHSSDKGSASIHVF